MASVSTNEMKSGTKVLIDGEPYSVIDNEYRKPGKGQATNSIKIRALKTGRVLEKTLRSGDSWEAADVEDTDMQYLYNDGRFWTLMDPNSFEQIQAGEAAKIGSASCRERVCPYVYTPRVAEQINKK